MSLDSFNGVVLRSRWIQLQRQRHEVDTRPLNDVPSWGGRPPPPTPTLTSGSPPVLRPAPPASLITCS